MVGFWRFSGGRTKPESKNSSTLKFQKDKYSFFLLEMVSLDRPLPPFDQVHHSSQGTFISHIPLLLWDRETTCGQVHSKQVNLQQTASLRRSWLVFPGNGERCPLKKPNGLQLLKQRFTFKSFHIQTGVGEEVRRDKNVSRNYPSTPRSLSVASYLCYSLG